MEVLWKLAEWPDPEDGDQWHEVQSGGSNLLSMLGQILFNIFCNDLDDVAEFTLSNFADNAKLRGVADTSESHAATERDLEKLEK